VWAMIKSDFVILGDVQILFPPNDFVYKRGTKVCLLIHTAAVSTYCGASVSITDTWCPKDGGSLFSIPNSDGEILRW
jgi:hypothetical protein